MLEKVIIDDVELYLSAPDEVPMNWVGQQELITQVIAAWLVIEKNDIPMNPRLVGKPGVGKTTLAYHAGRSINRPVYIFQATMDTRPEDLIITPVISEGGKIRYMAGSVVSAMIKGGVAIIDEGNRMSEKRWASLEPHLDVRRYVESIVAGIKIKAHPDFRFCTTMNDDASTFELPEYIHSRLQPQIRIDFPEKDEETLILENNLPFADQEVIQYVVEFLQAAHEVNERYSVRDGINIARYALKRLEEKREKLPPFELKEMKLQYLREASAMILDPTASIFFMDIIDDFEEEE